MSLKQQMQNDVSEVFLDQDDFAETVYLRLSSGTFKPVVCVVELEEPSREYIDGDHVVIRGRLHISDAIKGFQKDLKVKIRSELYNVTDVSPVEAGMRSIGVTRTASTRFNAQQLDPLA